MCLDHKSPSMLHHPYRLCKASRPLPSRRHRHVLSMAHGMASLTACCPPWVCQGQVFHAGTSGWCPPPSPAPRSCPDAPRLCLTGFQEPLLALQPGQRRRMSQSYRLSNESTEATTDRVGQPDWPLFYTPGRKARAEYAACMRQPGAEAAVALTLPVDADPQDLLATVIRETRYHPQTCMGILHDLPRALATSDAQATQAATHRS